MFKWFGGKKDPEQVAREAIQRKKWSRAISFYEKKVEGERALTLWNLLGDLHMNNGSQDQAVSAWRQAMEGYASEGLHENVAGIARKILRRAPSEEDVLLVLAEACLEMEYHADCLAAMKHYLRSAHRIQEPDVKSLFKKVLVSSLRHPHLLEELREVYSNSHLEDVELATQLEQFITAQSAKTASSAEEEARPAVDEELPEVSAWSAPVGKHSDDGLQLLDAQSGDGEARIPPASDSRPTSESRADYDSDYMPDYEVVGKDEGPMLAPGEGKDHYDLGNVYREMRLWDAAVAEFEQARRDPTLRVRSTLALSECLQEMSNLQGALDLLESESRTMSASPQEQLSLHFQLGVVNELLGNLDEALKHFEDVHRQNSEHAEAEERIEALRRKKGAAV